MDLMIGLAAVDEVTGGKEMRRLANGWMGWESKSGRRLRVLGAHLLLTLATRLDSAVTQARQEEMMLTPAQAA